MNGIEAKHSVLIFTHRVFSLSRKKRLLNAGLGVIEILLQSQNDLKESH